MSHAYISEKKDRGILIGALLALLFTLAFAAFTLAISSVLLLRVETPSAWVRVLGVLLPAISALLGGVVSAKRGGYGALSGLLFGVGFVLILLALAFIIKGGALSPVKSAVLYTAMLLLSVLGGVIGAHKPSRKRRKRRK